MAGRTMAQLENLVKTHSNDAVAQQRMEARLHDSTTKAAERMTALFEHQLYCRPPNIPAPRKVDGHTYSLLYTIRGSGSLIPVFLLCVDGCSVSPLTNYHVLQGPLPATMEMRKHFAGHLNEVTAWLRDGIAKSAPERGVS